MARELLFSITTDSGLVLDTFRSGGKGGQNQNKVESGVRIRHPESGAVGESREERSQLQNKRKALQRLTKHPKFTWWVHNKAEEIRRGESLEAWVEREMQNLSKFRVEYKDSKGRWVVVD